VDPIKNNRIFNAPTDQRCAQQGPSVSIRPRILNGVQKRYLIINTPLNFPYRSNALPESSHAALDILVGYLQRHPEVYRIQIQGFAGDFSDATTNLSLSRERAEAVRNYLVGRGLSASRFTVRGYGDLPLPPVDWHIGFMITGETPTPR